MAAKLDSSPISLPAAADLTTKLFRFGKIVAGQVNVCTVAGERASLIIGAHQKKTPVAGDAVDCYIERVMLVEAGAAFAADADLTTDALGRAVTATGSSAINAVAIDAAAAAGEYVRCRPALAKSAAQNVANSNTAPGVLVTHVVPVPDAATGDVDVVLTDKIEVLDVLVQKQGGATGAFANTIQVKNGAAVISDAISINGTADGGLVRATNIDDAASVIAAGGTLRVTRTKAGGNAQCLVTVVGIKRA